MTNLSSLYQFRFTVLTFDVLMEASENNIAKNFLVGGPRVRKTPGWQSGKTGAALVGEMEDHLNVSLLLQLYSSQK